MPDYWLRDMQERVLGPVSLGVVRDLVSAGRLKEIARISLDGRTWMALADFPGLVEIMASAQPATPDTAAQDQAQAQKLRSQLAQLQALPDADVFKVPEGASAQEFRSAFFALAKKFHPDRVPDGFPELRAACKDAVQFLSDRINARMRAAQARPLEQLRPPPSVPAAAKPAPAAVAARPAPAPVFPAPTPAPSAVAARPAPPPRRTPAEGPFDGSQFVGLERKTLSHYEAKVRITRESVSMFTQHALVNLANNGVFLPGRLAPLGSEVDLLFHFVEPTRDIRTTGKVVWENAGDPKHPVGFGVRYGRLPDDEKAFIKEYVEAAKSKSKVR